MTNIEKKQISDWFKRVTISGSFKQFDDLHLDDIETATLERSNWVEKGIECLKFAASIRESAKAPFIVALGFSLISTTTKLGINFNSKEEIERAMDETPPSLYLFRENQTEWVSTPKVKVNTEYLDLPASARCFFSEYKEDDEVEYRRVFWLCL
jgi:hypothetical protein